MERSARLYNCALCHVQVIICSHCDRGNIYCSEACAFLVRRASCSSADQRYQASYKGRMHHAKRQQAYRQRQRQKIPPVEIVTDHTSSDLACCDVLISEPKKWITPDTALWPFMNDRVHCHFCKKECSLFLRRGWMHRFNDYQVPLSSRSALKKMSESHNNEDTEKNSGKI